MEWQQESHQYPVEVVVDVLLDEIDEGNILMIRDGAVEAVSAPAKIVHYRHGVDGDDPPALALGGDAEILILSIQKDRRVEPSGLAEKFTVNDHGRGTHPVHGVNGPAAIGGADFFQVERFAALVGGKFSAVGEVPDDWRKLWKSQTPGYSGPYPEQLQQPFVPGGKGIGVGLWGSVGEDQGEAANGDGAILLQGGDDRRDAVPDQPGIVVDQDIVACSQGGKAEVVGQPEADIGARGDHRQVVEFALQLGENTQGAVIGGVVDYHHPERQPGRRVVVDRFDTSPDVTFGVERYNDKPDLTAAAMHHNIAPPTGHISFLTPSRRRFPADHTRRLPDSWSRVQRHAIADFRR